MKIVYKYIWVVVLLTGCGKDFLDMKRNSNQVVPKTVQDYLTILGHSNMRNTPIDLAFLGSDEYYVKDMATLVIGSRFTPFHKNAYVWADDVYEGAEVRDWNDAYQNIMYANLALDVEKLVPAKTDIEDWVTARFAARFYRAWNYYHLAQVFCKAYDERSAPNDLGLPLRSDYDATVEYGRSSLKDVYDFVIKDLIEAEELAVDLGQDRNIFMPGKLSLWAFLSRVYLAMGNYDRAWEYADKVLELHSGLVDFNELRGTVTNIYDSYFEPYGENNPSIIFYAFRPVGGLTGGTVFDADRSFFDSLSEDDLRKKIYFFHEQDGRNVYIGTSTGVYGETFTGLSTEELMLTRAECAVRKGDDRTALKDLNKLREHRYRRSSFVPLEGLKEADLLESILDERRKELYMRGIRWTDLRRLNVEGANIGITRVLDGEVYTLGSNSEKWVWPIPESEITRNNLQQNPR